MARAEVWISVDVEASGPTPSTGSLVALGACLVEGPQTAFYAEIQPIEGLFWGAKEESIHGLSQAYLAAQGKVPAAAMREFADWIAALPEVAAGARPVMVGFNATYDWMWVADYLHRFLGFNPLGISAPDIKGIYMGMHPEVARWSDTAKRKIRAQYPASPEVAHTHNALDDAREQAQLMRALRAARA